MNNKIPVNYIVFSSTRGHFENKVRFLETFSNINSQFPIDNFAANYCHIAVSPGEEDMARGMEENLKSTYNTNVVKTTINWRHGSVENSSDNSHQLGYLTSMWNIYSRDDINQIPYSFVSEDDFFIKTYSRDLEYYINKAVSILQDDSNIMQVRIPRFNNEFDRILKLKEKHNIDGKAIIIPEDNEIFAQNDWSNHPYIARTRDLRNTLLFLLKNKSNLPMHSEHGISTSIKYFSLSETPFICFNPENIRAGHRGTPQNQEDDLDQPLIAY